MTLKKAQVIAKVIHIRLTETGQPYSKYRLNRIDGGNSKTARHARTIDEAMKIAIEMSIDIDLEKNRI